MWAGGESLLGLENPVAISKQHADAGGGIEGIVGDGDIETAVAVEIRDRDRRGARAGGEGLTRLERTRAGAEQDADRIGTIPVVGNNQIKAAVAIDVSDGNRRGAGAGGET